jgi:hypothetical protein
VGPCPFSPEGRPAASLRTSSLRSTTTYYSPSVAWASHPLRGGVPKGSAWPPSGSPAVGSCLPSFVPLRTNIKFVPRRAVGTNSVLLSLPKGSHKLSPAIVGRLGFPVGEGRYSPEGRRSPSANALRGPPKGGTYNADLRACLPSSPKGSYYVGNQRGDVE